MYIQSKIETRYQTPHPSLELVSTIYYRANVIRDEVLVLAAWVWSKDSIEGTIDLCVDKAKAGNWQILSSITADALKKAYRVTRGAPNDPDNSQISPYYEYNP